MDLLLQRISKNAAKFPSKKAAAYIKPGNDGGALDRQLTYSELEEVTTNLAMLLTRKGLKPGDRVLLVYPPSLDFALAFLACLKAGVIAVPVLPPNPARKDTLVMFSSITNSSGAKFAMTSTEYNHLKKIAGIKDVFTRFKRQNASWPEQLQWIVADLGTSNTKSKETLSFTPSTSDVAFLQYTSGSTSEPKGVMITHGNLAHNVTIITRELGAGEDTIVVSWLPQYHDMGLIGSYLALLYCGGSGYYMSPLSFLQRPMLWIEAVSKYSATHLQAPNFAFKLVSRKFDKSRYTPETLRLSSVRHVINAAEPVDEVSIETFYSTFSPFGFQKVIFPTYGLAEHTVFVCSGGKQRLTVAKEEMEVNGKIIVQDSNNADEIVPLSNLVGCGYPANQGVDVRIVSPETFQSVDEDFVGEIWVNSDSKAAGYFDKPEQTKEDFHAMLADDNSQGDGYLRTGDLGFLHNGELFICGRLKDLIIVGGRNYYPQDIEATAEATTDKFRLGCSAAFTIDVTTEGAEEVALIMEIKEVPPAKDVEEVCLPLADTIRSAIFSEHSLGLAQLVFVQPKSIPKTSSGKIARAWCRKALVGETLRRVFSKEFKSGTSSANPDVIQEIQTPKLSAAKLQEIRAMDKESLLEKLRADVCKVGGVDLNSIDNESPMVTFMDSLTISQFKGFLQAHYGVELSDDYLFQESTTLTKMVDVIKVGYAQDDDTEAHQNTAVDHGKADGIAGALGCPPGVVCCVIQ